MVLYEAAMTDTAPKLSAEQRAKIVQLRAYGLTWKALAERFGVSPSACQHIVRKAGNAAEKPKVGK